MTLRISQKASASRSAPISVGWVQVTPVDTNPIAAFSGAFPGTEDHSAITCWGAPKVAEIVLGGDNIDVAFLDGDTVGIFAFYQHDADHRWCHRHTKEPCR